MSGLRKDLLIALAILAVCGPLIQRWSAQPASRYLLTVAAVDDRSLELDPYERLLGLDQAHYRGHVYTDKAPYQPLLAVPIFELYRAVGGESFPDGEATRAAVRGDDPHRGLWVVALWSATLPAIALAILIRRVVDRSHPDVATFVALGLAFGTVMLPFSTWLFGHMLGALTVMGAWALLRPTAPSTRAVFAAGLLLGLSIGIEYNVAVIALVFLVAVMLTRRLSHVAALSAGTVLATIPAMVYGWLVFENPFETAYQGHLKNFEGDGALGVYNLTAPKVGELNEALVGREGLLTLTPIMLLAVVGAVLLIRERGVHRREAWVAFASLGAMLLVTTGIDGLGGDTPGPRYLIPVIPLFAVPLAAAWRRFRVACAATALFGALSMLMATITLPHADPSYWIDALGEGSFVPNVFTGEDATWIALLGVAVGAIAVAVLVRAELPGASNEPSQPSPALR